MVNATALLLVAAGATKFAVLFSAAAEKSQPLFITLLTANLLMIAALGLAFWRKSKLRERWPIEYSARPVHYLQAMAQGSVYLYWSRFYDGVAEFAPLIAYQLAFAFLFHFLVSVLVRKKFSLGFSIVPIIFSINLFMWAQPDYFFLQIAMVMIAILSKFYLVRLNEQGKLVHIFNPSALPMALLALLVVIPGWNFLVSSREVVQSYFLVPHFYLFVFLVGCVSQWAGRTALVSFGALFGLIATDAIARLIFGMPLMLTAVDRSVFIGCVLLITDPATTPKRPLAQFIFGCTYGVGIVATYGILGAFDRYKIYDKILIVPVLNYFAPYFDRWCAQFNEPAAIRNRNFHLAAYAAFFALALPAINARMIEYPNVLSATERFYPEDNVLTPLIDTWGVECRAGGKEHLCKLSKRLERQRARRLERARSLQSPATDEE